MIKTIGVLMVVLAVVVGGIYLSKSKIVKKTAEPVKETENTGSKWLEYKNDAHKIAVQVPENWVAADMTNRDNLDLWVIFSPETVHGNITQVSLAVVSQAKPGQELATEEEFDVWYEKEDGSNGKKEEKKLMNNVVGDQKAITWYNKGEDEENGKYWMIVTWWRRDNKNFYLTTLGNKDDGDYEIQMHLNLLERISFLD